MEKGGKVRSRNQDNSFLLGPFFGRWVVVLAFPSIHGRRDYAAAYKDLVLAWSDVTNSPKNPNPPKSRPKGDGLSKSKVDKWLTEGLYLLHDNDIGESIEKQKEKRPDLNAVA